MRRRGGVVALAWLACLVLVGQIAEAFERADRYLILANPSLRQIAYAHLPDTVLRVILNSDLLQPEGVCVDQQNSLLFVTDYAVKKIFWYQLRRLEDGKLVTDGRQHVAVDMAESRWCSVDGVGNLFFSGKVISPLGPLGPPSDEAIFRMDRINIITGNSGFPVELWKSTNTATGVNAPAGVATDNFNVYWTNEASGLANGVLVQAPEHMPSFRPAQSVVKLSQNADMAAGVATTPKYVCWASGNSVYAQPKGTRGQGTQVLSAKFQSPQGLAYDNDATLFVADGGAQKIYSLPVGSLEAHEPKIVLSVTFAVKDITLYQVTSSAKRAVQGSLLLLLVVLVMWQ